MEKPARQNAGFSPFGPTQDALDNQWAIQMVEFMARQIDALQRRVESLERQAATLEERLPIPPGYGRLEKAPHRPPPPMRVIHEGWWKIEEREADIEEVEKRDE